MDQIHYDEMINRFHNIKRDLIDKRVYLFGHCEASISLCELLFDSGIKPVAILDNSKEKQGLNYRGVPVVEPAYILNDNSEKTIVLIVARFYEAMNAQLGKLGFSGEVIQLVNYNSYAEYSLSDETIRRKKERLRQGVDDLERLKRRYPNSLLIFCPFNALGDVYFCMSFLPYYLKKRGFDSFTIFISSNSCASVAELFGVQNTEVLEQKELDAVIQAVIHTSYEKSFIAHQDRPYVVNLHKALRIKCIPLETVYKCGVFGLPVDTRPVVPDGWIEWERLDEIVSGRTLVISPYAKSVTRLPNQVWKEIVREYSDRGYKIYTNVSNGEVPLSGTEPLRARLCEMKSILEKAGCFIGIRSGLCDVIRTVNCRKIALYPDYNYCDTKWKSIDMYSIEGFENIVVKDKDTWESIKKRMGNTIER